MSAASAHLTRRMTSLRIGASFLVSPDLDRNGTAGRRRGWHSLPEWRLDRTFLG
jgi:hypothetical protein